MSARTWVVALTAAAAITFGLFALAPATASAQGHESAQLPDTAFTCFTAGPSDWTHCATTNGTGQVTVVKVFDIPGTTFLGTELLVSADVYNGQPCATDGGEQYHDLSDVGAGPYACHHFASH